MLNSIKSVVIHLVCRNVEHPQLPNLYNISLWWYFNYYAQSKNTSRGTRIELSLNNLISDFACAWQKAICSIVVSLVIIFPFSFISPRIRWPRASDCVVIGHGLLEFARDRQRAMCYALLSTWSRVGKREKPVTRIANHVLGQRQFTAKTKAKQRV